MVEVNTIEKAVEIAKVFFKKVGFPIVIITKATPEDNSWYVESMTIGMKVFVKIDKKSGEILEYSQI